MNSFSPSTGEIRPKTHVKSSACLPRNLYSKPAKRPDAAMLAEAAWREKQETAAWITRYAIQRPARIACREDLSFTLRDQLGLLKNWHVDKRPVYWETGLVIGRLWFAEVLELAETNPDQARCALQFALEGMKRKPSQLWSLETGFTEALAEWAVSAKPFAANR
jgi:hypothetical protein